MKRIAAALLLCHVCGALAAEPLGRLFFTPDERARLDVLRRQPAPRPTAEAAPQDSAPPPVTVRYSGMVRRSDGRSTAWINDRPVNDAGDATGARARVDADGAARITLPRQGSVRLKVGQTAELASGRIEESYARPAPREPAIDTSPPVEQKPLRLRRKYGDERELPPEPGTP
jgi:hypothetical protein